MTILTCIRIGLVVGALVFLTMLIKMWWTARHHEKDTRVLPIALVGFVANFCDALGVGSFAIMTSCYKQFNLVDDGVLPGTLNSQSVMPSVAESLIFLTAVHVDPITLVSLVISACLGTTIGARIVAGWDRQAVRLVMSLALLVVAALLLAGQLKLFPLGGTTLGLTGWKLAVGIIGNFVFGALMTVGIGLFAPCMTMIYLLGMNPLAAFPIMMCSGAFLSFFSAGSFLLLKKVNTRASLTVAIVGPIGVMIAAFLVKSMNMKMLAWLVTFVVIYTAISMFRSWKKDRIVAA